MEYYFYTRLFQKVMMVEVTEYDEVITCDHSYDKRLGGLSFFGRRCQRFWGREVGENGDDDPHLTLLLLTALG